MAWQYFTKDEMKCKCGCNQCLMDEHFMDMLDSLRKGVGQPLEVNSGYRCKEYDDSLGGEGNHPRGWAVDLKCQDSNLRFFIIDLAIAFGFKRVGIAKTFIHLDLVSDHPQKVIWLY